MEAKDIKGLMEAYSKVNETPEVLNEKVVVVQDILGEDVEILDEGIFGSQDPKSGVVGQVQRLGAKMFGDASAVNRATSYEKSLNTLTKKRGGGNVPLGKDGKPITAAQIAAETKRRRLADPNYKPGQGVDSGAKPNLNKPAPAKPAPAKPAPAKPAPAKPAPGGGSDTPPAAAPKPAAPVSQTVLAKKGGVEGKLDKATGKFTAGNFSDAEKARYSAASQKSEVSKGMDKYNKDKAAISTAKTPEAKASATKTAEKSGMAVSQAKFGKDFAKPKTPNPLMKDMPGQNKAELEKVRGNAAIDSISKSPSAKKILSTSEIGKASRNRSEFGSATKPAPVPKPAAPAPKPSFGTSSTSTMNKAADNLSGKGALAPKPAPAKRETQLFHTDLFDLVKGHLLDEGYAETEEAAIVIMVNMSEEWRDEIVERYKGKHGQSSDEYKDDRSPGGKMVSGDSKQSGAEYTHGRRVKAENPGSQPDEGGKTKPKSQGKMDKGTRADLEYRKANLKKEEVELDENRRAARSAGGYKDDSEGQPDPSKEGFTGIGKMSIKDIMALNKKIEARKAKKEETQVEGDQIDEVLGGQSGDGYIGHPRLGIKNPMAKKQTNTNTSSNTGIAGKLGNRASQMDAAMKAARGQ